MSHPGTLRPAFAAALLLLACGGQAGDGADAPAVEAALPSGTSGAISAQYADSPAGEGIASAMDGKASTKYLTFHPAVWLQWKASSPTIVTSYALTSANDFPGRDPRDFALLGSNDGTSWTQLDARTGQTFTARFQKLSYAIPNTKAYTYYRLSITANHGDGITQLAEWDLVAAATASVVTLYVDCVNAGKAVSLPVGNYTAADLAARGLADNSVSAVQLASGFQATLYDGDGFTGTAITLTQSSGCLTDGNAFNDRLTSLTVSRSATPTAPATPTGLTAAAVSSGQVNLAWADRSDNETLFRIEVSTDGAAFASAGTVPANATSAAVTGLAAGTTYWFRVRAENGAGASAYSNAASATTQAVAGDWSGFVPPAVDFTDQAAGLEGSTIFHAAIPDVTGMMKEQCLAVVKELYTDNADPRVNFSKLHLVLQDDPTGVAAKWGGPPEIWIGISAQYIASFFHANGNSYDLVQKEVRGVLSHEGTHGYQAEPRNCGTYDGSSTYWGFIEGEADGVRAELTNWTPARSPSKGGSWNGGYTTGGFFLSWCKHHKKPTFLIELNHAARDLPTFTWDAAFQQILGQSVQSAWDEYQASLP